MSTKLKIKFTKSPTGAFNLAYNAGDVADFEEKQARLMIKKGFATTDLEDEDDSDLPADIPAREVFVGLGVSLDELKEVKDFTSYQGIGKASAKKLEEYFKKEDPEKKDDDKGYDEKGPATEDPEKKDDDKGYDEKGPATEDPEKKD